MGLGVSLILIAAGAILVWGVTGEVSGLDLDAVGVILMVVGLLGFLLSLVFWSPWAPYGRRRTTYVAEEPPVASHRRTTVVEDDDVAPGPPPP